MMSMETHEEYLISCPAKFFGVLSARLSCNASVMRISVCDRFQIFGRYGPTKPAVDGQQNCSKFLQTLKYTTL